jgi:hypothetical protein
VYFNLLCTYFTEGKFGDLCDTCLLQTDNFYLYFIENTHHKIIQMKNENLTYQSTSGMKS